MTMRAPVHRYAPGSCTFRPASIMVAVSGRWRATNPPSGSGLPRFRNPMSVPPDPLHLECSCEASIESNQPYTLFNTGKRTISVFVRSEEHTSELQSLRHLVCRL